MDIQSLFVRRRNVLCTRGCFTDLYTDYFLHLGQHGLAISSEQAEIFKSALAAFTLHCAARPRMEHVSWTINFQRPLLNIFLVADTGESTVAGRAFTENVKIAEKNSFYQEVVRSNQPLTQSFVDFSGRDPLLAAERFYEQSEQRPARFFQMNNEEFAIVSAHPDFDKEWFKQLTLEDVSAFAANEELNLLETRKYRWHCGCSLERIYEVLANMCKADPEGLFQGSDSVIANCPRCAAKYPIERALIDRFLTEREKLQ